MKVINGNLAPGRKPDVVVEPHGNNPIDEGKLLEIWIEEQVECFTRPHSPIDGPVAEYTTIKLINNTWHYKNAGGVWNSYSDTIFENIDSAIDNFIMENILLEEHGGSDADRHTEKIRRVGEKETRV